MVGMGSLALMEPTSVGVWHSLELLARACDTTSWLGPRTTRAPLHFVGLPDPSSSELSLGAFLFASLFYRCFILPH